MPRLSEVRAIGRANAYKFEEIGIRTTWDLLRAGATAEGRAELASKTGIPEDQIADWVVHADLMRLSGVGEEYCTLLKEAGVEAVKDLAELDPERLWDTLKAINEQRHLTGRVPSMYFLTTWIQQAKSLPPAIQN